MSRRCRRLIAAVAVAWYGAAIVDTTQAEEAVGLEAQGIDPWAALNNPGKLDVRDELGRPVSARLIERQLKVARAEEAIKVSFASRAPKARTVAWLLEMFTAVAVRLTGSLPPSRRQSLAAVASPRPGPRVKPVPAKVVVIAGVGLTLSSCSPQTPPSSSSLHIVLRC